MNLFVTKCITVDLGIYPRRYSWEFKISLAHEPCLYNRCCYNQCLYNTSGTTLLAQHFLQHLLLHNPSFTTHLVQAFLHNTQLAEPFMYSPSCKLFSQKQHYYKSSYRLISYDHSTRWAFKKTFTRIVCSRRYGCTRTVIQKIYYTGCIDRQCAYEML